MIKLVFWLSKVVGGLFHKHISPSGFYFFFPIADMGGGERVHLAILENLNCKNSLLIIENRSANAWLHKFKQFGTVYFSDFYLSYNHLHRLLQTIFWGVIIGSINKQKNARVFLANVWTYNWLIDNVHKDVWIADIIHAVIADDPLKYLKIDAVPRISKRFLISNHLKTLITKLYEEHHLSQYNQRLHVIENNIELPNEEFLNEKIYKHKIIYLGRIAHEKRLYLIAQIAAKLKLQFTACEIVFIGPTSECIQQEYRSNIEFTGKLTQEDIQHHFKDASVIILTSIFEGFPLAIMEAMAHGVIPVCTNVGALPNHIKDGYNGFLISSINEQHIVDDGVKLISEIWVNQNLMNQLGSNAHTYAVQHFYNKNYKENIINFFEK